MAAHARRIASSIEATGGSCVLLSEVNSVQSTLRINRTPWERACPRCYLRRLGAQFANQIEQVLQQRQIDCILLHGFSAALFEPILAVCARYPQIPVATFQFEHFGLHWQRLLNGLYWDSQRFVEETSRTLDGWIGISRYWEDRAQVNALPCVRIPALLPNRLTHYAEPIHRDPLTPTNPFHLVTLGGWSRRECTGKLFLAIRALDRRGVAIRYTALGTTVNRAESLFYRLWRRADPVLRNCVTDHGWVCEAEKERIMAGADAFILLRRDNCETAALFPTRLPEYLIQGKPTILSNAGDLGYYVRHGESAVLIDPANRPEAIADAIQELATNPQKARAIGAGGWAAAREHFSQEANGKKLVAFIQELVARKRTAGATGSTQ